MDLLDSLLGKEDNSNPKKDPKPKRMSLTDRRPGLNSASGAQNSTAVVPKRSDGINKRPNENAEGPGPKRTTMFAQNPSTGTFNTIEHMPIQLNMFEVNLDNCPPVFERIHMDITLVNGRGKEFQMNGESLPGDVNESHRRWALWNIYKCVVKLRPDLFNADTSSHHFGAYDCASALYMPFGTYKGGEEQIVEFGSEQADPKTWAPIAKSSRAVIGKIRVKLQRNKEKKSCGKIYMSGEKLMDIGNRCEAVRCMEIITSQETHTRNYYQFGNSTFNRSSDMIFRNGQDQIDRQCQIESEGKEIKTGFDKSIRMVIDDKNTPKMLMTIDVRRSPFYKHMPILKWLTLVYGEVGRRPNEVSIAGRSYEIREDSIDSRAIEAVIRLMENDGISTTTRKLDELRSVGVCPIHLDDSKNNVMYIQKFDFTPAKENMFTMNSKDDSTREISIYEYFLEKYNIRLKYPNLPIAVMRGMKSNVKVPLEMLRIERGQRVKQNNISPAVQQEMTGKLSMLPRQHVEKYTTILNDYLKVDQSQHLKAFGIKIEKTPFLMVAKILPAPVLNFGDCRKNQPETGVRQRPSVFNKQCRIFLSPAKLKSVILVNFNDVMQEFEMRQFATILEKSCRDHGMQFEQPSKNWKIVSIPEQMHEELDELLKNAKKDNTTIVLGITNDKRPDVHDVLKLYEAKHGQQTAHLSRQVVKQIMESPTGQTLDNVVRKFNLKCGGSNFTLSVPRKFLQKQICTNEKEMQEKLFKNTMFIGFELSHAGATCEFDQQNNISCGEPSVVGVSYSFADPLKLGGFSYLQMPREHSLHNLSRYFPTAVVSYSNAVRALPQTIVIYRSGMGEGDLRNIETDEVGQMRKSLIDNEEVLRLNNGRPYEPKIVLIVVLKKSHHRIFPAEIGGSKSFDQNVPSGTCIDYKLTSGSGYEEFLLVSQSALIGTIRPTKYVVLVNDKKWLKTEIVHLTYFLSFGHQVSTNPPGVPAVLYAAENLAKRGRNNFKINQRLLKYSNVKAYIEAPLETDAPNTEKIDQLSDSLKLLTMKQKTFWA